jgi:hypothetical protein
MEVGTMYDYDGMYEVKGAIEAEQLEYVETGSPPKLRSKDRQWDAIICTVCAGCGKPLGSYENQNRLAYCFDCRRILFPETIHPRASHDKRWPQLRPR